MHGTRAATLYTGVLPRMLFRDNHRAGEFSHRDNRLTGTDPAWMLSRAQQLDAELAACVVDMGELRWHTTDAGSGPTPGQARKMLIEVLLLERAAATMDDKLGAAPGLAALLSNLAGELMSWVEYWDSYSAERPTGFAHDCPEPVATRAPLVRADDLEPQPPTERARQLAYAPGAPPAGITAS
jgi:hypothetical protein